MTYQLERFEGTAHSPEIRLDDLAPGPGYWLRAIVARLWAGAALRRLLGRRAGEGVDSLPPHLLRDIGLPPNVQFPSGLANPHPPV